MKYKDKLREVIKNSNLTLRDIASRCQEQNVTISYSYISQIQSGKLPPPAEEVTIAICKACNAWNEDLEDLVFLGYIEKAPEIVQGYFIASSNANIEIFNLLNKDIRDKYKKDIDTMSKLKILTDNMSKSWKISTRTRGEEYITKYSKFIDFSLKSKDEHYYMPDNSMEPTIPKNALLTIESYVSLDRNKRKQELMPKNNDIIVFEYLGQRDTYIRRYQRTNDIILLKSENSRYDTIQLKDLNDIIIYGKVINYTASID